MTTTSERVISYTYSKIISLTVGAKFRVLPQPPGKLKIPPLLFFDLLSFSRFMTTVVTSRNDKYTTIATAP